MALPRPVEASRPLSERLRDLPREARDTLLLLAICGQILLPLLGEIPLWCAALVAVLWGWRLWTVLALRALPPRWAVLAVAVAGAGAIAATERPLLGQGALVTLLVLLMALKTLEMRARRDTWVLCLLGFFLVIAGFIQSQSLLALASMLVSLAGLLTALVLAHRPVGRPPLLAALGQALRLLALGAPMAAAAFVLFPRIGPLWGMPDAQIARTGLSQELRFGDMGQLAQDSSIALRIRPLPGPDGRTVPVDPKTLYLRGPTLSHFDGRTWTPDSSSRFSALVGADSAGLRLMQAPQRLEITVEPSQGTLLALPELSLPLKLSQSLLGTHPSPATPQPDPALPPGLAEDDGSAPWQSTPAELRAARLPLTEGEREGSARLLPDLSWQTDQPIRQRQRLEVMTWPAVQIGPFGLPGLAPTGSDEARPAPVWPALLRANLQLPPGNERTIAWAHDLRRRLDPRLDADADAFGGADDPAQQLDPPMVRHPFTLVQAVLSWIRHGQFRYTLTPGVYRSNPIDAFWFDRREGFCEHYAAATVIVLRAMGIPARIVTGYQGADPVPQDGYWVVRQSNAHAWVEYWHPEIGWVRVDPTAAVAPDRIAQGIALDAPSPFGDFMQRHAPGWLPRLQALGWDARRGWETLNNRWNQWVLGYDRDRQEELFSGSDWPLDPGQTLALSVSLLALIASAVLWLRQRRDPRSPWQRFMATLVQDLSRRGHLPPEAAQASPAALTPLQLGQRLQAAAQGLAPERQRAIQAHVAQLDAWRYGVPQSPSRRARSVWLRLWRRQLLALLAPR
ncbi:transglutaminaseTgpA domain-containing protein [Amphibiibacter pelophylacis]|uniref:DUF3488 and transglutaminase-like domain-containing protein n=1 Tax=Amphibiibacter pelophylacis TaxID=1799477 RepID=A0ACC6P4D0_9BURK